MTQLKQVLAKLELAKTMYSKEQMLALVPQLMADHSKADQATITKMIKELY